jgi:hypothetical protein
MEVIWMSDVSNSMNNKFGLSPKAEFSKLIFGQVKMIFSIELTPKKCFFSTENGSFSLKYNIPFWRID